MNPYRKDPDSKRCFFSDRPEQYSALNETRSPYAGAAIAAAIVTMVVGRVALSLASFHAAMLVACAAFVGAFTFFGSVDLRGGCDRVTAYERRLEKEIERRERRARKASRACFARLVGR